MKEYNIGHVRDMLAIPEAKQAAFLADLAEWMTVMRQRVSAIREGAKQAGVTLTEHPCAGMTWIDDGRQGMSGEVWTVQIGNANKGEK
jgi:hypothetical protein